ncbi:MAG TPA: histidine kinase [Chitinophagaceae bacterium]|nr:histidine kinase [Chitinophagaceae bacterium]
MKWIRPRRVEWVSFYTMMPVLCFVLNYLLFGDRIYTDERIWLYSFPVIFLQGLVSWYLHIAVMYWLRIKFPLLKQTSKRLSILALAHISMTFLTFVILFYTYDAVHFLDYNLDKDKLRICLFVAIALTMVATTMWEAVYTFKQWKISVAEKEKLEQLTIQYEFDTLKSQVNPHFLFNCFNTLSSLISEDRKQAETFLNELSKVYRYLLRNNESGLSTVKSEIQFINSYYELLKTRHNEALQMTIEVDKKYEQYLLPSLSLQLLIENAVKHNQLSRTKPLLIDVFTTAGKKLIISNNLQRRIIKSPSNRIGLENIRSKYLLLEQTGFQVLEDGKTFSVVLPLIWHKVLDKKLVNI